MPQPEHALLEIALLRTFVVVCESGSFAAASKAVCRTPSAVSMQMNRLEELLGQDLFKKSGRSIELSRHGEMLLGYARQILRLNQEAVSRFRGPSLEGRIRFGAPDDFGVRFLPDILARFAETHPDVSVDVVLAPSVELMPRFKAQELDLTLITTGEDRSTLHSERILHTEDLYWFGLKGGIARHKRPVPLALAEQGCSWRAAALRAFNRSELSYRVSYSSENCQGQLAALRADLAIAPLPASLAGPELERISPEDGLPAIGAYQLRLLEQVETTEAGQVFARHVVDSFREMAPVLKREERPARRREQARLTRAAV